VIDLLSWLIAYSSVFSPFAAEMILMRAYTTVDLQKGGMFYASQHPIDYFIKSLDITSVSLF
jgi:hypothetical protein